MLVRILLTRKGYKVELILPEPEANLGPVVRQRNEETTKVPGVIQKYWKA